MFVLPSVSLSGLHLSLGDLSSFHRNRIQRIRHTCAQRSWLYLCRDHVNRCFGCHKLFKGGSLHVCEYVYLFVWAVFKAWTSSSFREVLFEEFFTHIWMSGKTFPKDVCLNPEQKWLQNVASPSISLLVLRILIFTAALTGKTPDFCDSLSTYYAWDVFFFL